MVNHLIAFQFNNTNNRPLLEDGSTYASLEIE